MTRAMFAIALSLLSLLPQVTHRSGVVPKPVQNCGMPSPDLMGDKKGSFAPINGCLAVAPNSAAQIEGAQPMVALEGGARAFTRDTTSESSEPWYETCTAALAFLFTRPAFGSEGGFVRLVSANCCMLALFGIFAAIARHLLLFSITTTTDIAIAAAAVVVLGLVVSGAVAQVTPPVASFALEVARECVTAFVSTCNVIATTQNFSCVAFVVSLLSAFDAACRITEGRARELGAVTCAATFVAVATGAPASCFFVFSGAVEHRRCEHGRAYVRGVHFALLLVLPFVAADVGEMWQVALRLACVEYLWSSDVFYNLCVSHPIGARGELIRMIVMTIGSHVAPQVFTCVPVLLMALGCMRTIQHVFPLSNAGTVAAYEGDTAHARCVYTIPVDFQGSVETIAWLMEHQIPANPQGTQLALVWAFVAACRYLQGRQVRWWVALHPSAPMASQLLSAVCNCVARVGVSLVVVLREWSPWLLIQGVLGARAFARSCQIDTGLHATFQWLPGWNLLLNGLVAAQETGLLYPHTGAGVYRWFVPGRSLIALASTLWWMGWPRATLAAVALACIRSHMSGRMTGVPYIARVAGSPAEAHLHFVVSAALCFLAHYVNDLLASLALAYCIAQLIAWLNTGELFYVAITTTLAVARAEVKRVTTMGPRPIRAIVSAYGSTGDVNPLHALFMTLRSLRLHTTFINAWDGEECREMLASVEMQETVGPAAQVETYNLLTRAAIASADVAYVPWAFQIEAPRVVRIALEPPAEACHYTTTGVVGLDWVYRALLNTSQATNRLSGTPTSLPRSCDGVSFLHRVANRGQRKVLVTGGSSTFERPPVQDGDWQTLDAAMERHEPRTNHADMFRDYEELHCHGGFGTVMTALSRGMRVVSHGHLLDRRYIVGQIERLRLPFAEGRILVPLFLSAPSAAPGVVCAMLLHRPDVWNYVTTALMFDGEALRVAVLATVNILTMCWRVFSRLVQAPTMFGVACVALSCVFMVVPGVAQTASLSALARAVLEHSFWTARVPFWLAGSHAGYMVLCESLRLSAFNINACSLLTWVWLSVGIFMPGVWHEHCVAIHVVPLKRVPVWFHAGIVADGCTYEGDFDAIGKRLILRKRDGVMGGLRLPLPIPRSVMSHAWHSFSRNESYSPWANCVSVAFKMATFMPLGAGLVTFAIITLVFLHTIWGLGVLMFAALVTSDFEGTLLPVELIQRLRQMAHSAAGDAPEPVRTHHSEGAFHPFSQEYIQETGCEAEMGMTGFLIRTCDARAPQQDREMMQAFFRLHQCFNCGRRCSESNEDQCWLCMRCPGVVAPRAVPMLARTWHDQLDLAVVVLSHDTLQPTMQALAALYHLPIEVWTRQPNFCYHRVAHAPHPSPYTTLKYLVDFVGEAVVNWRLIVGNKEALHWRPDAVEAGRPPAAPEVLPITETVTGEGAPVVTREERKVKNKVKVPMYWTRAIDRMFAAWANIATLFTGSPVILAARSAVGRLCQYGAVFCEDLVAGTEAPICCDGPSFKAISREPKVAWAWVPPRPFDERVTRRRMLAAPLVEPDLARASFQPGADSAMLQDIEALNKHCPDGQLPLRLMSFRRYFSREVYTDEFLTRRGDAMQQLFRAEPHVNAATYASAEVLNQVNARYARAGFAATITADECSEISQALREELPHFFNAVELVDPEFVMAKWVRKYSAGLPFEGQRALRPDGTEFNLRYRRDLHATGWAAALANRVREELHKTGETLCGIHHGFPKAYPLAKSVMDLDPTKLRGITAQCAHQYVRDMVFSYQLNKRAPSFWAVAPWMAGLPINGAGLNHVVKSFENRKHIFALDYSAFDSWINEKIISIIVDLRASGFLGREDAAAARSWIEANYESLQHGYIFNLIDGSATEKNCGLSTGQASVTLDGSLACIIVAMGAFVRSGAGTVRQFFSMVSMRNMGDDHVIATDLPPSLFSANFLAAYARGVHGIPAKIEGQTMNGPVGLVLLQRECVATDGLEADFDRIGLACPPWTFRMRQERIVNVQDVTLRPVTLRYLYDRAIGHLLNCAHHEDVYDSLVPFARELRQKLKANKEAAYVKRRKIPSYEDVLRIWYKPVHEPQVYKRRVDPWSLYLDAQFSVFVVVGRVGRFLRTMGAHALSCDGERVAANEVYRTAAMDIEAFAYTVRNPSSEGAFLDDVRTSPFSVCAAPRHFWQTERSTVTAIDADYFTRRMALLQVLFVGVTYSYNRLAVVPVFAVFARVYSLIFFEYGSYYGTLSSLHWLGTGGPSRALSMLFPRDPFILHKRVSATLLDLTPPHVALAMPPSPVWAWIASYVHLFARALSGGTAILPFGTWAHGVINHDEWESFFHQPHVFLHVKKKTRFSVASPTGTAKTMGGAAALARMFVRVIVLVPRKALAKALTDFTWVKRGVVLESSGRIVMTYGYFYSRFIGARNLGALVPGDDLVLCDEFHEASCTIRAVLAAIPQTIHLGLMSATPRLSLLQLANVPLAARFATGFLPKWEVQTLSLHGIKPEDAVCTIMEGPSDVPQRMMVIVPSLAEARTLASRLEQQGHLFEVIDASTSPTELKWSQGHVVATQVADAGITLPGVDCVVDSGRRLANHRGVLTELYSDASLSIQRKGRTGRTCNGLYVPLMPPSGVEVEEYPSVDMYFADIGFWEGQFVLNTGIDTLLGAQHYLEPTLALNDEFVVACGCFEVAEALARIALRCDSFRAHDEILLGLKRGYLPEIIEDVLSTCIAELSVESVLEWPASRLAAIKPFLINHGGRPVTVPWLALREGELHFDGVAAPKRSAVAARQSTFAVTGAAVEGRDVPRGLFRVHCGVRVERTTHWRERRIMSVLHAIAREAGFEHDRDVEAVQAMFARVNSWADTTYCSMEYFQNCNWLDFLGHACQSLYIHFVFIGPIEPSAVDDPAPLSREHFERGWEAFRLNRPVALGAWGLRPRAGTLVAPFWLLLDSSGLPQRCVLGLRRLVRFEGTPAERLPRVRSSIHDSDFAGYMPPTAGNIHTLASSSETPGAEPLDVMYPWVAPQDAWEQDLLRCNTVEDVQTGRMKACECFVVQFGMHQVGRCGWLTTMFYAKRLGVPSAFAPEDMSQHAVETHMYEEPTAMLAARDAVVRRRLSWCEGLAEFLGAVVQVHVMLEVTQGEFRVVGRLLTPTRIAHSDVLHVMFDGCHVAPVIVGGPRDAPTEFVRVGPICSIAMPRETFNTRMFQSPISLSDFHDGGHIMCEGEGGSFLDIARLMHEDVTGEPLFGVKCDAVRCGDPVAHRPRDLETCPLCSVARSVAVAQKLHVCLVVQDADVPSALMFTAPGHKTWTPAPPVVLVRDARGVWKRGTWVHYEQHATTTFYSVNDGMSMTGDGGCHMLRKAKPLRAAEAYVPELMTAAAIALRAIGRRRASDWRRLCVEATLRVVQDATHISEMRNGLDLWCDGDVDGMLSAVNNDMRLAEQEARTMRRRVARADWRNTRPWEVLADLFTPTMVGAEWHCDGLAVPSRRSNDVPALAHVVLLSSETMFYHSGGLGTVVETQAKHLRQLGHAVYIVQDGGDGRALLYSDGIWRISAYEGQPWLTTDNEAREYLRCILKCVKQFDWMSHDTIFHVHGDNKCGIIPTLKRMGFGVAITVHSTEYLHQFIDPRPRAIEPLVLSAAFSDVMIWVSSSLLASAVAAIPVVANNAVVLPSAGECWSGAPDDEWWRARRNEAGVPDSYVVYAGRYSESKGLRYLFEALALLGDAAPFLVCAGSGNLRASAGPAFQHIRHHDVGKLTQRSAQFRAVLSGAITAILPSTEEPQGMMAVEAALAPVRVITIRSLVNGVADNGEALRWCTVVEPTRHALAACIHEHCKRTLARLPARTLPPTLESEWHTAALVRLYDEILCGRRAAMDARAMPSARLTYTDVVTHFPAGLLRASTKSEYLDLVCGSNIPARRIVDVNTLPEEGLRGDHTSVSTSWGAVNRPLATVNFEELAEGEVDGDTLLAYNLRMCARYCYATTRPARGHPFDQRVIVQVRGHARIVEVGDGSDKRSFVLSSRQPHIVGTQELCEWLETIQPFGTPIIRVEGHNASAFCTAFTTGGSPTVFDAACFAALGRLHVFEGGAPYLLSAFRNVWRDRHVTFGWFWPDPVDDTRAARRLTRTRELCELHAPTAPVLCRRVLCHCDAHVGNIVRGDCYKFLDIAQMGYGPAHVDLCAPSVYQQNMCASKCLREYARTTNTSEETFADNEIRRQIVLSVFSRQPHLHNTLGAFNPEWLTAFNLLVPVLNAQCYVDDCVFDHLMCNAFNIIDDLASVPPASRCANAVILRHIAR